MSPLPQTHIPTPPTRLLVVQLAEIGNALLSIPALQALREGLPAARIDVLTTGGADLVLRDSGLYDDLIVFDKHRFDTLGCVLRPRNIFYALRLGRRLRAARYDAVLLLHHLSTWAGTLKYAAFTCAAGAPRRLGLDNGRGFFLTERVIDRGYGERHELDYALEVARLLVPDAPRLAPSFAPSDADRHHADGLLAAARARSGPSIALHPGSGGYAPARRWPASRFAELADRLIGDGATIVLVGGAEEALLRRAMLDQMRYAAEVIELGGRTSLPELAAVLARCDLFVGNDGGVMHLAATAGTPVVAPFGPTDPRAWGPWSPEPWQLVGTYANGVEVLRSGPHTTLKASIPCSPCIYRGPNLGSRDGCPDRTCLARITVDQVYETVRERLKALEMAARIASRKGAKAQS